MPDRRTRLNRTHRALRDYLAARPGEIVTREMLLVDVWKASPRMQTRTVAQHVYVLRQHGCTEIETVHGVGYRWRASSESEPDVSTSTPATATPAQEVQWDKSKQTPGDSWTA